MIAGVPMPEFIWRKNGTEVVQTSIIPLGYCPSSRDLLVSFRHSSVGAVMSQCGHWKPAQL